MKNLTSNAEMAKAILDNLKTNTRRTMKPQPYEHDGAYCIWVEKKPYYWGAVSHPNIMEAFPYGEVGDVLWLQEPFAILSYPDTQVCYEADNAQSTAGFKWAPAQFMPRWASRINIVITERRVERIQDISFEDCLAEGILSLPPERIAALGKDWEPPKVDEKIPEDELADELDSEMRYIFGKYWGSIYGEGAFERNDWVWVISFQRHII